MKKFKLTIFSMILVMLFVTGCEEESIPPEPYSNGLLISLGSLDYDARDVSCSKGTDDYITFTAMTSNNDTWNIKFYWGQDAQNGDIVFISDNKYNKITLDTPNNENVDDYRIDDSDNPEASETFIRVLEYIDGKKIEAEVEGFIYKIGSSTSTSLKNGYFITSRFE